MASGELYEQLVHVGGSRRRGRLTVHTGEQFLLRITQFAIATTATTILVNTCSFIRGKVSKGIIRNNGINIICESIHYMPTRGRAGGLNVNKYDASVDTFEPEASRPLFVAVQVRHPWRMRRFIGMHDLPGVLVPACTPASCHATSTSPHRRTVYCFP